MEPKFGRMAILSLLLGLLSLTVNFTSCSNDDEANAPRSTDEVSALFKSVFLKYGDLSQLKNAKEGYYCAIVDNGETPCQLFSQVTGVPATASSKYEFSYQSPSGDCSIRIVGQSQITNDNIRYATVYVKIPGIPNISVVELFSEDLKNSENAADEVESGIYRTLP